MTDFREELTPEVYVKEVAELFADLSRAVGDIALSDIDTSLFSTGITDAYDQTVTISPIDVRVTIGSLIPRFERHRKMLENGGFLGPIIFFGKVVPGIAIYVPGPEDETE
jgi:hypothetical protein